MPVAKRRTQLERRTETTRRLLDAATDSLIELGYAGASIQAICERAGVSQGGLFRHFPTRETLMVAVGEDVADRILATYAKKFESLRDREQPLVVAMRLVREQCRSRLNQAWYELAIASRTNASLRKSLVPAGKRYEDKIERLARTLLPDLATKLGDRFPAVVGTIIAVFDGEVIHRLITKDTRDDDARMEVLMLLAGQLLA
ncbi:MAG TPA: TetR/AcrR family transcriptional regulator [Kofleriaceae bacterium]|jgi:AcrR family transcriptional regulator|nr:TetR/AcrR family transcriptional regulator [Kofleriaceae bacterium]